MLNNVLELQEKRVAAIMPTLRCNITCEHCIMSCKPGTGDTMTPEQMENIVRQFVDLQFNPICLTGGEPFLFPELIRKTSEICAENQTAFVIQTNGFWAKTGASAQNTLKQVPYLTQLGFSVDYEHMKFIDRHVIENGIQAAYDQGIDNVSLSVSYQTDDEKNDIHEHFSSRYPKLEISMWPITALGRAFSNSKLRYSYEKYGIDSHPRGCEVQKNFTPIVTPSGDFHLCYHLIMLLGKSDPFFVGNIFENKLEDILGNLNDPLFNYINAYGGGSLGYLIGELKPELLGKKYQRTCEFCYEVMSDAELVFELRALLSHGEFQERIAEILVLKKSDAEKAKINLDTLVVCDGKNCFSQDKSKHLRYFLTNRLLDTGKYKTIGIECTKCFGQCDKGPNIMLKSTKKMYSFMNTEKIENLIHEL